MIIYKTLERGNTMDCTFKKWGYGHHSGPPYCEKKGKRVSEKCYKNYCSNSCYCECPIYINDLEKKCFFTVILCPEIKTSSFNVELLMNLKRFRKNVLEKNYKYRDLLVYHDRISPLIADAIRNTNINGIDEFLKVIYENYIIIISNYINSNEVEKAVTRYQKMLELLIVNFSLNKEYANMQYRYKHPELYKPKSLFRHIKGGK